MAQRGMGTCTNCGEEDIEITVVDEETMLCEDCLEELDYIFCDECEEYWLWDAIKFYNLKDGRVLCENCAEDKIDNGELGEEDIEFIANEE